MRKKYRMNLKMIAGAAALSITLLLTGCGADNISGDKEGQDVITTAVEDTEADAAKEDGGNAVSETAEDDKDLAPDFTAELVGGGSFSLSENRGKVVLINIWATWCGPCVEEMPAFEKLNGEYGDDVKIICVNYKKKKKSVDRFVSENGYTFPVAYDEDGAINGLYPTDGIPYTLVIGKDGKVKNSYVGSSGMEEQYRTYKAAIDAALAE